MKKNSLYFITMTFWLLTLLPTPNFAQSPCPSGRQGPDRTRDCRILTAEEFASEALMRIELISRGIEVNHPGCPAGVHFGDAERAGCSCTSVRGLQDSSVRGLQAFRNEAGIPLIRITGGTECGHKAQGHISGTTVDVSFTNDLYNYIVNTYGDPIRFVNFCARGSDESTEPPDPQWESPSGALFTLECNGTVGNTHWHIEFPTDSTKLLTLEKYGDGMGNVISTYPMGIDCGSSCANIFTKNRDVQLKAVADQSSRFDGWIGDIRTGAFFNEALATMSNDKIVIARFVRRPDPPPNPLGENSNCWDWDPTFRASRGAWIWGRRCTGNPPSNRNDQPPDGCWHFDASAGGGRGGWIYDPCGGDNPGDRSTLRGNLIRSLDPNDKIGPQGVEATHWLSGEEPLRYAISFENLPTASAPAQEVVITDQLDVANLDLRTFSLGPIQFGDRQVVPEPGLAEYTANVDLRPDKNLIVRIEARLDNETGALTWRFTSIDPAMGDLPEDPLIGFLPPNKASPEGQGAVLFNVLPKSNLPTGTEIRNRASIVFDLNAPIATQQWSNKLDFAEPISKVLPLNATQTSLTFDVRWAGTDEGSGVRDYTIYVSDNSGPFTPWLSQTTNTQAAFTGQDGHTYAFFSVARDLTINHEGAKTVAETTTRVVTNRAPVAKGKNVTLVAASSCQASVNPNDIDDGSFDPDGDGVLLTLSPAGPFGLGTHAVMLTATDSHGASDSVGATVTVIDQTPPTITNVLVSPSIIWPADRKMVDVIVSYDTADNCGQTFSRLGVSSNEPLEPSDIEIVDAHHLRLRAARRGVGDGRTYKITILVVDGYGNLSSKDVLIRVPHDRRN